MPSSAPTPSDLAPATAAAPVAKDATNPASPAEARPFLAEYQDPKRDQEMPVGRLVLDLFVKLAIVLGIAYGFLYLLRGFMARQGVVPGRRGHLRVLESASLGPNRSIHLVRVGGKVMVVGSTPEQVSSLGEVEDDETLALLTAESAPVSFTSQLSGALSRDESPVTADAAPLATQVRGSARHLWDQVQEIRGLRGKGGGR